MATVRIVNPAAQKSLTREQVAQRQARAVEFTRNIVKDPALADEIADLTPEQYAKRKGFRLENPKEREGNKDMQQTDETDLVREIRENNRQLRNLCQTLQPRQSNGRRVSNPNGEDNGTDDEQLAVRAASSGRKVRSLTKNLDEALDAVEEAQSALDDGDTTAAQEILSELLEGYEEVIDDEDGD